MLKHLLLLFLPLTTFGQTYYYPPVNSDDWARTDLASLGWCAESVDTLLAFAEAAHSKSLIILKDGRIVVEAYFGTFQRDSLWYWASAGKSLMGALVGLAQQDGLFFLEDPVSDYLGKGWTTAPPEKEDLITIRHQITMTTGLDDSGANALGNCLEPACLTYLADAGTRWAYHNSPYRLVQDVLEKASGQNKTVYTYQRLGRQIGMKGLWLDYVFYSTARDMARFGHFILAGGVWAGDTIFQDRTYLHDMLHTSQELNKSYGYLWWLNGKESFMIPTLQIVFPRPMIPEAPADMVAALGKNDQKIYVVPSEGLVVVRQGNAAGSESPAALSSFDNQLWERIGRLACSTTAALESPAPDLSIYPNPGRGEINFRVDHPVENLQLFDLNGRKIWQKPEGVPAGQGVIVPAAGAGIYFLRMQIMGQVYTRKLVWN